jgi:endonuclease-8
VQTFLPYPSFRRTARVLDDRRLGKQRVEALQILNALHGLTHGWVNHPAVVMWRGYEPALALYGLAITREWQRRGYADTVWDKLLPFVPDGRLHPAAPPWLGDPLLHRSHRCALVRKDPDFYAPLFPDADACVPYVWPAGRKVGQDEVPEGHLLHRIARDHRRLFRGRALGSSSPQGRFPDADRLDGLVLDEVEAYGKHLLYRFGRHWAHVHLGLQGTFLERRSPPPEPLAQVRWRIVGASVTADLVAPRTCELLDADGVSALLAKLGPDPLRDPGAGEAVYARVRRKRQAIGAVLLDQGVVAGVGSVLQAEALSLASLDPDRPANAVRPEEWDVLWTGLVALMERSADEGRIERSGARVG